jgi:hypothetical protein
MRRNGNRSISPAIRFTIALFAFGVPSILWSQQSVPPQTIPTPASISDSSNSACEPSTHGSAYIPVDSWIYPAVMRLYALGYASDVFLGLRPWTRASVMHMLENSSDEIQDAEMYGDSTTSDGENIYVALKRELNPAIENLCPGGKGQLGIESSYSAMRAISGVALQDSFHLGSTVINDYGRPFERGFNDYSGLSGYASAGRFLLYVRGEFQHTPSAVGYSAALAQEFSAL